MPHAARRRIALATVLSLGFLPLAAGPAHAEPDPGTPLPVIPVPDDFDGDGYGDLVVAAPDAGVAGKAGAGAVTVLYGSAPGTDGTRHQLLTQDSPGVPGTAAAGNAFGHSVAAGDLDGDGYTDLAVGAPYETVGDAPETGSVTIMWGSPDGLVAGTAVPPVGVPGESCQWGLTLLADEMTNAGAQDLSVGGACSSAFLDGPFTRDGVPESVLTEDSPGVPGATGTVDHETWAERVLLPGPTDNSPGGRVWLDNWVDGQMVRTFLNSGDRAQGTSAAIADTNLDGYGDLVLGNSYDGLAQWPVGGHITVLKGWSSGPSAANSYRLHEGSAGLQAEYGDAFGASVSTGDVNGDGYADVAVGVPGRTVGGQSDAGVVVVFYSTGGGPTGTGAQTFDAGQFGGGQAVQAGAGFGRTVRLADRDGDGRAELTVGAPGQDGVGCVWTADAGGDGRLTADGASAVCGDDVGLDAQGSGFGSVLTP
ncbi:FG-GAP repeat protein [Streptomyces sp. RFCAC02]|uniref:FG-GAP repeat protein n=1 Tax=Streptomyces sp. RFCAC02 TaxID=2499143 RepID=UPI00143D79A8|nr:FG-GAP repeat protein [Streptomyces sp. RFCAC02]